MWKFCSPWCCQLNLYDEMENPLLIICLVSKNVGLHIIAEKRLTVTDELRNVSPALLKMFVIARFCSPSLSLRHIGLSINEIKI